MKFTRHARPTRASLEAAPWVAVMFLLVMFLLLVRFWYLSNAVRRRFGLRPVPVSRPYPMQDPLSLRS
ncbi:MAG: hypothetical protein ACK45B_15425, partial [Limisphaerales bacterium]